MTRTRTNRRIVRKSPTVNGPRAVVLAGIGAASLCRKQAIRSVDTLSAGADALRKGALDAAKQAGGTLASLRRQAGSRLAPVQAQAARFAKIAQTEFEARFAPVLVALGVEAAASKRPARQARRVARPAAKRSRKRA